MKSPSYLKRSNTTTKDMDKVFKTFVDGMKEVAKTIPEGDMIDDKHFDEWYKSLMEYYEHYNIIRQACFSETQLNELKRNKTLAQDIISPEQSIVDDCFMSWYGTIVTLARNNGNVKLGDVLKEFKTNSEGDSVAMQMYNTFYIVSRYNGY
jgi:hypothetical protein